MRNTLLAGAAIVAASLIGVGAANAQGVVSCSTFNQLSGPAKTAVIEDIVKSMPSPNASVSGDGEAGHVPGAGLVSEGCKSSPTMTANDIVAQVMNTGNSTFQGMEPKEEMQLD